LLEKLSYSYDYNNIWISHRAMSEARSPVCKRTFHDICIRVSEQGVAPLEPAVFRVVTASKAEDFSGEKVNCCC
jgi:hypothetical protein